MMSEEKRISPLKVGDYTVDTRIAKGSYAEVYGIISGERRTVMKIPVYRDDQKEFGVVELMELDIGRRFKHPHLSEVIDYFRHNDELHLVMPHYGVRLINHPFKPDLPKILYQMASTCRFLHRHGIIHGDAHVGNIMVLPNGHATLIDAGLARYLGDVRRGFHTTAEFLNLLFRPPENIEAKNKFICRDNLDVWSLALSILNAYVGKTLDSIIKPFIPKCILQWVRDNLTELNDRRNYIKACLEWETVPHVDKFISLLAGMLDPNPVTRFSMERVVNDEYFLISNFKVIEAKVVTPTTALRIRSNSIPYICSIAQRYPRISAVIVFHAIDLASRTSYLEVEGTPLHGFVCFWMALKYRDFRYLERHDLKLSNILVRIKPFNWNLDRKDIMELEWKLIKAVDGLIYRNLIWDKAGSKMDLSNALKQVTDTGIQIVDGELDITNMDLADPKKYKLLTKALFS